MTRSPFPPTRRHRRAATLLLCAGLLVAWGLACAEPDPPRADADWPPGALLSARTGDLRALLLELEALRETPLARSARRLREALPDCPEVEAAAERPEGWIDALRCTEPTAPQTGLRTHRGSAAVALAVPLSDASAPRLLMRAQRDRGSVQLDVRWPTPDAKLAALLPGSEPSGPGVLDERERLLHARVRVDGPLDLAALVPSGSQADTLFHLRAGLLGAAVLDGTWEAAIYPPMSGDGMPRVAIALGVRHRAAAQAAAERLLDDVEQHWSVSRTPLPEPAGEATGACLLDLRLLPELAPCYATTEHALVFAWNLPSLRRALGHDGHEQVSDSASERAAGHLEIDLTRLREADLRLAQRIDPTAISPVARWPWRRLVASGDRRDGDLAVRIALESIPPEIAP